MKILLKKIKYYKSYMNQYKIKLLKFKVNKKKQSTNSPKTYIFN